MNLRSLCLASVTLFFVILSILTLVWSYVLLRNDGRFVSGVLVRVLEQQTCKASKGAPNNALAARAGERIAFKVVDSLFADGGARLKVLSKLFVTGKNVSSPSVGERVVDRIFERHSSRVAKILRLSQPTQRVPTEERVVELLMTKHSKALARVLRGVAPMDPYRMGDRVVDRVFTRHRKTLLWLVKRISSQQSNRMTRQIARGIVREGTQHLGEKLNPFRWFGGGKKRKKGKKGTRKRK